MRQFLLSLAVSVALGFNLIQFAAAEGPSHAAGWLYPSSGLACPDALLGGCCDDYCSKPLPCTRDLCYGCGKDDYCMKPLPSIPCFPACRAADCYCRKPCPTLCRPLSAHYFTCAKWPAGCADVQRDRADAVVSSRKFGMAERLASRSTADTVPPVIHPSAFGEENAPRERTD
jgi:hypothetical protein